MKSELEGAKANSTTCNEHIDRMAGLVKNEIDNILTAEKDVLIHLVDEQKERAFLSTEAKKKEASSDINTPNQKSSQWKKQSGIRDEDASPGNNGSDKAVGEDDTKNGNQDSSNWKKDSKAEQEDGAAVDGNKDAGKDSSRGEEKAGKEIKG